MNRQRLQLIISGAAVAVATFAIAPPSNSAPTPTGTPKITACQGQSACVQNRTNTFIPPDAPNHCTPPSGAPVDSPTPVTACEKNREKNRKH